MLAQGIVGETYNRMLVGDAAKDPKSQYYLPDDYTFRGKGSEEAYLVDGYFGETADSMFTKVWLLYVLYCVTGGSSWVRDAPRISSTSMLDNALP